MPVSGPDVLVVGAGVSGLTTAVCLAEAGRSVEIRADRLPPDTTSAVAGAMWGPHLVETGERAARWRRATLAALRELAAGPGSQAAGVRIADGIQVFRGSPTPRRTGSPSSVATARAARRSCRPGSAAAGATSAADPHAHLSGLPAGPVRARGRQDRRRAPSPPWPARRREAGARVIVNCSGAYARQLAGDPAVTPVRGQTVVAANPGPHRLPRRAQRSSAELAYLFPHGEEIILGGSEADGDWNLEPVPAIADRILRDCAAIEPRLRGTRVLAHRVGLRPVRPTVRLEAEPGDGGPVIVHNYGHGGGGVTLSWGCAREAACLAAGRLG